MILFIYNKYIHFPWCICYISPIAKTGVSGNLRVNRDIGQSMANYLIYSAIGLLCLLSLLWVGPFLVPDKKWDSRPKVEGDLVTFNLHKAGHPGHFSFLEKIGIAAKVNVLALFFGERARRTNKEWETFYDRTHIGEAAPEINLTTTTGEKFRLKDLRGTNVAIMFVAMTCPPARLEIKKWEELVTKFASSDVHFILIYSREQHPGEAGYRGYHHTISDEDRATYADELAETTSLDIAIDPVSEVTLNEYGIVPNGAFVVDRKGRIVFKTPWADAKKISVVLENLTALQANS